MLLSDRPPRGFVHQDRGGTHLLCEDNGFRFAAIEDLQKSLNGCPILWRLNVDV